MKKVLALMMSLAIGVSLLAACGTSASGSGAAAAPAESGGASAPAASANGATVEIQILHGQPEEERVTAIQSIIDGFMAENPGITVTQLPTPEEGFWTKITTQISSGQLPALVEGGVDQLRMMNAEEAIDTAAVTEAIELAGKDRFFTGALEMAKAPGVDEYLGMPVSGWVSGIWYRKSLFEENNLEPPTTWENIVKAAETLNDPANKFYGIMFPTEESDFTEQMFNNFAHSNNVQIFDAEGNANFNTPEVKEVLELYKDMYQYTMPGSNGVEQVKDAMVGGHTAMAMYSTYIMGALNDAGMAEDIGFAIPEKESDGAFGMTSTMTISSMIDEQQREAAIKFLAYMASADANITWCHMAAGGSNPVLRDVASDPAYMENDVLKAFGETAETVPLAFEELKMLGVQDGEVNPAMGNISAKFIIPRCINQILVQGADIDAQMEICQQEMQAEVDALG